MSSSSMSRDKKRYIKRCIKRLSKTRAIRGSKHLKTTETKKYKIKLEKKTLMILKLMKKIYGKKLKLLSATNLKKKTNALLKLFCERKITLKQKDKIVDPTDESQIGKLHCKENDKDKTTSYVSKEIVDLTTSESEAKEIKESKQKYEPWSKSRLRNSRKRAKHKTPIKQQKLKKITKFGKGEKIWCPTPLYKKYNESRELLFYFLIITYVTVNNTIDKFIKIGITTQFKQRMMQHLRDILKFNKDKIREIKKIEIDKVCPIKFKKIEKNFHDFMESPDFYHFCDKRFEEREKYRYCYLKEVSEIFQDFLESTNLYIEKHQIKEEEYKKITLEKVKKIYDDHLKSKGS